MTKISATQFGTAAIAKHAPASATITPKASTRTRNRSVSTPAQTMVIAESVVPMV